MGITFKRIKRELTPYSGEKLTISISTSNNSKWEKSTEEIRREAIEMIDKSIGDLRKLKEEIAALAAAQL